MSTVIEVLNELEKSHGWDKLSDFTKAYVRRIFRHWPDVDELYTSVDLENWMSGQRVCIPVFSNISNSNAFIGSEDQCAYMDQFFERADYVESFIWPIEVDRLPVTNSEIWQEGMVVVKVKRGDIDGL